MSRIIAVASQWFAGNRPKLIVRECMLHVIVEAMVEEILRLFPVANPSTRACQGRAVTYFRPVTWLPARPGTRERAEHEETISSHVSSKGRHQEASLMTFCRSDHFNGITMSQVRRNFEGSSQLLMVLQRHDSDGQPTDQNISRGRSTNRARTILKTSIRSMPRMPRPAKFE